MSLHLLFQIERLRFSYSNTFLDSHSPIAFCPAKLGLIAECIEPESQQVLLTPTRNMNTLQACHPRTSAQTNRKRVYRVVQITEYYYTSPYRKDA